MSVKDEGKGAPSRAHADSTSIVIAHTGRNTNFISACCIWRRSTYQVSCRKPFCGGAQDETRIATIFVEIAALSETLRQSGQECATRTELRRKDAEPGAAADPVGLVEQVEDVETQFHPL